jgi:hypothetical protein
MIDMEFLETRANVRVALTNFALAAHSTARQGPDTDC